jgi:hypothetical protein
MPGPTAGAHGLSSCGTVGGVRSREPWTSCRGKVTGLDSRRGGQAEWRRRFIGNGGASAVFSGPGEVL